jgi:hypothetical protein
MQSMGKRQILNILEAFPEDEGLYKCLVTNPAGQTSTSAYLKIERKFRILFFLHPVKYFF